MVFYYTTFAVGRRIARILRFYSKLWGFGYIYKPINTNKYIRNSFDIDKKAKNKMIKDWQVTEIIGHKYEEDGQ